MEQPYLLVLLVMQLSERALTAAGLMFFYDELHRKLQHHNYAKVLESLFVSHLISRRQKYYFFSFLSGPTFYEG